MFCVVYEIDAKAGCEQNLIECWKAMTMAIAKYEGGLGARLHDLGNGQYVAYAQWPNRAAWEKADGSTFPAEVAALERQFAECRVRLEVKYKMEVVEDLLQGQRS